AALASLIVTCSFPTRNPARCSSIALVTSASPGIPLLFVVPLLLLDHRLLVVSLLWYMYAQDPNRATETTGSNTGGIEGKQSKSQQLKKVFQEYGIIGISLHIGISLISVGLFYMVVSSGVDMSAILLKLGFQESLVPSSVATSTSTFVVAYAIHKLFAPVRISITVVTVPFLVRYFRKVGLFKPPDAKP
uniref:Family with sequence similarity 210 member B n=1 Tax=Spermophilus dauricus TaxID=99837 RepID=A0A8C9QCW5_SPEDA